MAAKEVDKDKVICSAGQALSAIHVVVSGSVTAKFDGGSIVLKKGDVVGLLDIAYDAHSFTYVTNEVSSFVSFPMKDKSSVANIVKLNPEVGKMMFTSMIGQSAQIMALHNRSINECNALFTGIKEDYDAYVDACNHNNIISRSLPAIEDMEAVDIEDDIEDYVPYYYASMRDFPQELKLALAARVPYLNGFLHKASADIHECMPAIEMCTDYLKESYDIYLGQSGVDLFELYTSLLYRLKPGTPDAEKVTEAIESMVDKLKEKGIVDEGLIESRVSEYRQKAAGLSKAAAPTESGEPVEVNEDLSDATNIILAYSGVDDEIANNFRTLLNKYKKVTDKASSDDPVRKLRLELTKAFYQIYTAAFQNSVKDYNLSPIMKMFFNFGFVDAELAGAENANYLYTIAEDYRGDEDFGVYTAYEWLNAVYHLKKEPSRNEFDTDYTQYIHEQKIQGKITAAQEQALARDPEERLMFELNNMFPMCNKVTFGRLSSFCPLLSEHDIIKPLQSCIVTVDTVLESLKKLEAIDYGAFYRETVYADEKIGITKEFIDVRITPDIILFPNVGTRGVMWQEIEGKKRTTPARFMFSIFHMEDFVTTLTRLTGEYRWEMCKRVQGARWNDVSDRSLTSEYFDYVQFYKKNSELSTDAKEKVKNALTKAKNSFKEMFVRDYITWVLFEGAGSPRLNKVARQIMVTYCPFPAELREKIAANPMFKDMIERYNIKTTQKLHHFDNVLTKIKAAGQEIPDELVIHRKFIEGTV